MRTGLLGLGVLLVAATGVSVVSAQHTPPIHHVSLHQICEPHAPASGDTAASDHASILAARLDLTAEQRATVERISNEACAAMTKYHQQILDALTPEQQIKLKELHENGSRGLHAWFRKLHGR
jgi:Spy/CpxP family protein refolding chaperone